jgi:SpoIID/LytB domain protein
MQKSSHYLDRPVGDIFFKALWLKPINCQHFSTLTRHRNHRLKKWLTGFGSSVITVCCLVGFTGELAWTQTSQEIDLEVGVVQRFGRQPTDELILKATEGDRLTLTFLKGDRTPRTLQTEEVKLEISQQPLPQPILEERLVLSSHRSFENAEADANELREKGIQVEIAQPGRWQVWAKRDIYKTPLLRRLLLISLPSELAKTAFLETEMRREQPVVTWVIDGFRYNRRELDISAGKGLIQVSRSKDDKDERLYPGTLQIQPNAYGSFTLVNEVPLESYLRGVVPHEVGAGAPYAALEAQAIIARTYVLRNLRRFAVDDYQICADTQCQVYKGIGQSWPPADRAIAATAGKVLTYNNELVDALYSSTTGGITASFNDMWDGSDRPYLQPVVDSVANVWDLSQQNLSSEQNFRKFISLKEGFNEEDWDGLFRWREESVMAELNKDLRKYLQDQKDPLANFKTIQEIKVVDRSNAGRVITLSVKTDRGSILLRKDEILRAFYAPLSTFFYLERIYGADKTLKGYAFVGGGFGHGVGLSQTGSHRLAKLGWSSDRILKFYYPGSQIQPINNSIIFWQDP